MFPFSFYFLLVVMDVMKPELMWIEGRCYRINQRLGKPSSDSPYVEEDLQADYNEYDNDEPCDEFEVESLEGGRFKTSFHVARAYFPYIIGMKGNTRRRIEGETRTQVKVPKQGQEGDVVVVGNDQKSVCAARRRINLIVMSSRLKQPFTHFLCFPVNGSSVQDGFLRFKEAVLKDCKSRGVDSSLFQSPAKLHLTLATLVLSDNEERRNATETLQACKAAVIDPVLSEGPLKMRMCGVEYMNDDPREVDVLYGKVQMVDGSNRLQELANNIVDYFSSEAGGYCEKQYDAVKLHVTLMNTLFRKDEGGVSEQDSSSGQKRRPRESFDATQILETYRDFVFGEEELNSIHLSQRYTTSASGFYQASISLTLS